MAEFTKVAKITEVEAGCGKVVEAQGKTIALFNCDGQFFAVENACKHRGGPLGEGMLSGTSVTCPWHGWEYDVKSGACMMDESSSLKTYPVKVEGEDILVGV